MQYCSGFSCDDWRDSIAKHIECKPCCGYIVERIMTHQQEHLCFNGMLEICGLPSHLKPPLRLRGIDVVCIAPQSAHHPDVFRLILNCLVADCNGCRACGEAHMTVSLRQIACRRGENLRLGAKIEIEDAQFCPPCAFFVRVSVRIIVVTSGEGKILSRFPGAKPSPFLPLYPAPACECKGKTRRYSPFGV